MMTVNGDRYLDEEFVTDVLRSLVRINSMNPGGSEAEVARRIAAWLEPSGAAIEFVESLPGRPSLGVRLRGAGSGPTLVLNGHIDTVEIDDPTAWDRDPLAGEVEDGWLYGRGACDMKAGCTTQIAAALHLAPYADRMDGDLVLHFAMGEERSEPGTLSLVEHGYVGDYGIVTEPTELRVAAAQRGATWYTIRIAGRSIHASQGHLGQNPIHDIPRTLDAIQAYAEAVQRLEHPLLPGGSCHATLCNAGVRDTSIPDMCEIVVDRRLLPGETVESERVELERRVHNAFGADADRVSVAVGRQPYEPAEISSDSEFANTVLRAAAGRGCKATELWGTPFSSDIGVLINQGGVEAVTFGPGNVAEAHCANERVELAQVSTAARVLTDVAKEMFGIDDRGKVEL